MSVIISHEKKLKQAIAKIKVAGPDNLHVLSDFDRTLTYAYADGQKVPSLIAILRNGHYLSKDYAQKAHALFDKYHPLEIDPQLSLAAKKTAMNKWWRSHIKLLIKSGLNKKDLELIASDKQIRFRKGLNSFLNTLQRKNIPLVILSASGVGEAVKIYFKQNKKNYSNIHYITSSLVWNKAGQAIAIKEPIIHSLSKDETLIKDFPKIYQQIKNRKNVLLLGDSLADVDMIKGFDYDNLIKIGFLNYNTPQQKKYFLKNFDIVIEGDEDFTYINQLLKDLCK
ncbi:MAG: hypothetical protein WCV71_03835 [Patescibacteria group bacterium]|jgi:5'-nucleotidase